MSLSVALKSAQSALAARQTETAAISRNIAGAQQAGYTRKSVMLSTIVSTSGSGSGVRVDGIARSMDAGLYKSLLRSTSIVSSQYVISSGLEKLAGTTGDTELQRSSAAQLGKLETAVQNYAADPGNSILAQSMLQSAKDTAKLLNEYTSLVQGVRADADADIAGSVQHINELLAQIESLNSVIVKGLGTGADVSDAMDARDLALLSLSEEVGISTLTQSDGGIVIYTDSGVTLFETSARTVSFAPTNVFTAGTVGNAIFIDGVPVTGSSAIMPISSGNLFGLTELRDNIAVTYQNQLDEIARGLIAAFAESDQTGGGSADQPGLFTFAGATGVPASATLVPGLAGSIMINPAADPDQGGSLDLLRDGGLAGADYIYNPEGFAGYSDRLNGLVSAMNAPMSFDPSLGLNSTASLKSYASSSVGWLEAARKSAAADLEVQSVIVSRTSSALSNATGVNIDEEMTLLLDIERAYGAAAKLISAVDRMLQDLLDSVR
ncbi:flagellar hook-associated protein FlgK [Pannonibacter phragmitetus]|uniref:flagellar hook-associated protein FlgK n=1 Tax=Pannonibacter phragmitetus TaxID=121719 RepID=UPI000B9662D5|nr:flagellar hook-associated protein FlgK [Pannonibacter phragmitetus]